MRKGERRLINLVDLDNFIYEANALSEEKIDILLFCKYKTHTIPTISSMVYTKICDIQHIHTHTDTYIVQLCGHIEKKIKVCGLTMNNHNKNIDTLCSIYLKVPHTPILYVLNMQLPYL